MKKKRILSMLIGAALISALSAGCSSSAGSGTADTSAAEGASAGVPAASSDTNSTDSSVLRIGLDSDPPSYDPADFNSSRATLACYSCYDTLLKFSEDGTELLPDLAESWEQVDDTTYVYKIRQGVKFNDGTEMTADDVVFSLNRIMDPDTAASMSYLFESVESFEKTGDYELTVKLKYPDATWKFVPATSPCTIVSKAAVEAAGDEYGSINSLTCVGTGPYKLESWSSGTEITLVKNENYWGDTSTQLWDKVVYSIIPDNTSMALAAQSGQLDYVHILGFEPEVFEMYKNIADMNFTTYASTTSSYIALNCAKAPFDDVNLRKACAYAIDKASIAQAIGQSYAHVSKGVPMPSTMFYMDEEAWNNALDNTIVDYTYDLDKAKEYLAKSAYPDGTEVTLYTTSSGKALAEIIQYQLGQIGVTVNINEMLKSESYEISYGYKLDENGNRLYDIYCTGWLSDYLDPIGYLKPFWSSKSIYAGGANQAVYSNEEVDKYIDSVYGLADDKERAAAEIEAFRLASEDCPYITLYDYDQPFALSKNYTLNEGPAWFWNFQVTDIAKAE